MANRFRLGWKTIQNALLSTAVATFTVLVWPTKLVESPLIEPFRLLETLGYDGMFYLRGPTPDHVDPRIMVVGFDRGSEVAMGENWPIPRRLHAQAIRNLKRDGAKIIAYDILFSGPTSEADDRELSAALKEAGNVVLTCRIDRDRSRLAKRFEGPYFDPAKGIDFEGAASVGFAEIPQDIDGVVRRALPTMKFQDEWIPSFGAAIALRLQGLEAEHVKVFRSHVQMGAFEMPRSGPGGRDPVDGSELPDAFADFSGGQIFPMDVTFQQVAFNEFAPGTFEGKIVFVGLTGVDLTKMYREQYATAYTRLRPEQSGAVSFVEIPGVVVQAHMFNTLVAGEYIRLVPAEFVWAVVFVFVFAGSGLVRHYPDWRGPAGLLLVAALYAGMVVFFFGKNWHLPYWTPIGLMLSSTSLIAWAERGSIRRKWSGYVSPAVFERILREEGSSTAERYEATVLFGDIRGFTSLSDSREPEQVVRLLNAHFDKLTDTIYAEHGTIDKFLGDGILAVFGAPLAYADSAGAAVRAAVKMRDQSMEVIHVGGEELVLATGFGITTGPFVAGHVGGKKRHDFTVIGDVVNVSSRLQGVTGQPDVIIDQATYDLVRDRVEVEPLGEVVLKGKPLPVACYKVLRMTS